LLGLLSDRGSNIVMKIVSPAIGISSGSLRGMRRRARFEEGSQSMAEIKILEEGLASDIKYLWFRQGKWTCFLESYAVDCKENFQILLYGGKFYPYPPRQNVLLSQVREAEWILRYVDKLNNKDEWSRYLVGEIVADLISRMKTGLLSDRFFLKRNFEIYKDTMLDGIWDIVRGTTIE
jgi:hypothetical protein